MPPAPPVGPILGGFTVTLISSQVTGRDGYGNDVRTAVRRDIPGCAVAPGSTSENLDNTVQVTEDLEVYMPAGTVVTPEDSVEYQGITYRVMGQPESWQSPFTGTAGPVRLRLRLVTGASGRT
jgi:hypothetical protein